jgi:hypothetical protein
MASIAAVRVAQCCFALAVGGLRWRKIPTAFSAKPVKEFPATRNTVLGGSNDE